jgi:SAM-dependent methyltransferase
MQNSEITKKFRRILRAAYPELAHYPEEEIYAGKMGPGGLYLAVQMVRRLHPTAGERILDVGCGRGASSVFLAKEFAASVVALDLWISPTENFERFQRAGVADRAMALNLDITAKLPFADDYFDAIFMMDTVHYYAGNHAFWHHLLRHLKLGGRLCIGSPCFSDEFSSDALVHLPSVYDSGTGLWPDEFSKYHSPLWWKNLLAETGLVCEIHSEELEEGVIFWEDEVLYDLEHGQSEEIAARDADQYSFRQPGMPYLTHFVLYATKQRC